ncbi:hypothetical protein FN846DRAFT_952243 [Sphaerosporella brunnea]|uniref:WD40-repeat-containing domain protein n=1 Tax=Sphaerosporella brunnea TaxID=1250544 RepID=A0A5J5EVG9_9PEZI|nr:hypothetical protein FN846DRAFT_952243 [Sphaerosporella brunnea]
MMSSEPSSSPHQEWPRISAPPRLVASTGNTYHGSIFRTALRENAEGPTPTSGGRARNPFNGSESNLFKSVQWTPDGTTLLTHSEDDGLRTFILPPDLLSASETALVPYCTTFTSSRVFATAIYPLANISQPESFIYLCSPRGEPIRLHSLLHPGLLSSYPLINPNTEVFETPYSLLIPSNTPNSFLAGTNNQISIFDLHRCGDGPVTVLKTTPARHAPATTTTMKGLVTAMALSDGMLAAGTNTRQVGLYAGDGGGEVIGVFTLPPDHEKVGRGVTGLSWSACGRYLYIAERRSDVVSVYDIRVTGHRVASLCGRAAGTNQRLGVDVATGLDGEVVAGGTDGVVRIWKGGEEGGGESVGAWQAHQDVVSSAVVHPFGSVVATCSGSRKTFGLGNRVSDDSSSSGSSGSGGEEEEEDQDNKGLWDNSLKVWEIPSSRITDQSP